MAGVIIKLKSIVQFILVMNWRFDFRIIYSYGFQKFKIKYRASLGSETSSVQSSEDSNLSAPKCNTNRYECFQYDAETKLVLNWVMDLK